ncbi:sphinganine-1-phosphate aldolase [Strigomonas culicis]|uniref:sphinganine-1-phosphate aldolase n=1 Tax=Strigomonas culicis TaxID=28005 RepID=S9VHU1_9TRYP|nr:sphinganine-1-phosphate aldolase [Strigomonas culicis]|eukprot:EPY26651.1 sphinganine-1-phosphate aldolase [Strigomonas culicis]
MTTISEFINTKCEGRTPTQVVLITVGATITVKIAYDMLAEGRLLSRGYKAAWRAIRVLASPVINKQISRAAAGFKIQVDENIFKAVQLPEKSKKPEEVLALVKTFHKELDLDYSRGGFSGAVYHGGASHTKFMNDVMAIFQWSNPLHSSIFGASRKMEAEVVSMVLHMYNGDKLPDASGAMTSGGTESILMAMKTYRDWARDAKGIYKPSVVAPITLHPAFDKAAEYFSIELIKVPVRPDTRRVDPAELEKYIRYDTIAIIGSAPNFPHGVVDPIEELAEIAYRHHIGMHVDCCLGGFIMPFIAKTGRSAPVVDFRNRGVTSISCDTHKYGYAPKGTSTIMYRSKQLRSHQFVCVAEWPGGMYCSPAVSGSKPGNVIAATWAAMVQLGEEGYVQCCDRIMNTREYFTSEIAKIPYLSIIGEPTASVFAFTSKQIDIFEMGKEMEKQGWYLNVLQYPAGLQFSVTMLQTEPMVAKEFIDTLKMVGEVLMQKSLQMLAEGKQVCTGETSGTTYGSAHRVPDRSIIQDVLREFISAYYDV